MKTVTKVKPLAEFKLYLEFDNSESRVFDLNEYLNHGLYKELNDISIFNSVHISFDTIQWSNGLDICPETLYAKSLTID